MGAKVFIVDNEYRADRKVFFVDNDYQQRNHQLIMGGTLVKNEYEADMKVFIMDNEYRADILITRRNFPK